MAHPFQNLSSKLNDGELAKMNDRLRVRVARLAQATTAEATIVSVFNYDDAQRCADELRIFVTDLGRKVESILESSMKANQEFEIVVKLELEALKTYITKQKKSVQKFCRPYQGVLTALEGVVTECQSVVSEIRGGGTPRPTSVAGKRKAVKTREQRRIALLLQSGWQIVLALLSALILIAAYFILTSAANRSYDAVSGRLSGIGGAIAEQARIFNKKTEEGWRPAHLPPERLMLDFTDPLSRGWGVVQAFVGNGMVRGIPWQMAQNPNNLYFSAPHLPTPTEEAAPSVGKVFSPRFGFIGLGDLDAYHDLFTEQENFMLMLASEVAQEAFRPTSSGRNCVQAKIHGDRLETRTPLESYAAFLVSSLRPVLTGLIDTNPKLDDEKKRHLFTVLKDEIIKLQQNPPQNFNEYRDVDYKSLDRVISTGEDKVVIQAAIENYLGRYGFETLKLFDDNFGLVENIVEIIDLGGDRSCPTYRPTPSLERISGNSESLRNPLIAAAGAYGVAKFALKWPERANILFAVVGLCTEYANPGYIISLRRAVEAFLLLQAKRYLPL